MHTVGFLLRKKATILELSPIMSNTSDKATNKNLPCQLTIQQAVDIARNAEHGLESGVAVYLEEAMVRIWDKISCKPDTYVLSAAEFAVFNFYRHRYHGHVAERAVERYWRNARVISEG